MPDDGETDDLFEDLDKFFAPIKDVEWEEPAEAGGGATPIEEEHVSVHPEPQSVVTVPSSETEPEAGTGAEEESEDDWYDTASLEAVPPSDAGEIEHDDATFGSVAAESDEWIEPAGAERPSEAQLEEAAAHFADPIGAEDLGEPRIVQIDEDTADDLLDELGAEPYPPGDDEHEDAFADMAEEEPSRTVLVGAEGLGGPSWQEPAAVEVGADLDRRGGERDVPAAFLTGIVLAGVAIVSLLIGDGVFAIFAGIVALIAQGELYGVMVAHHRQPATAVGLVTGALVLAGAYYHAEAGLVSMLALGVIATFLWFMTVAPAHRKDTLVNVGLTLLGVLWIPALAGSLLMILAGFGEQVVIAVVGLAFVFDTVAFLSGSVWGGSFFQRPLAPATSPRKSVEGLLFASLATIALSTAVVTSLVDVAPGIFRDAQLNAMFLGVVVALSATFGDLAESLVKRDVGVKDMGSVLPGHGGVLDRIDSLLFVAPAALLFLRVIAS